METKIIVDSCYDFNDSMLDPDIEYARVPFSILIDDNEIIDENINTTWLIDKMQMTKNRIGTACPPPEAFFKAIDPEKNNYIVTISSKLSGSYNSAMAAKQLAEEKGFGDRVFVFDSLSAACGENLVGIKIAEMLHKGLTPEEIVPIIRDFIHGMTTFFILNSMDNLVKNGRIKPGVALVGKLLKISPIMMGVNGEIELKEKVRGKKKSFKRLAQIVADEVDSSKDRIFAITHVNARETAEALKSQLEELTDFKKIVIFESGGLSTVYADRGGIVVAY